MEYDGTRYHGFQWQANATTVQEELEQALGKLTGNATRVVAASRTDAGVHAKGQVVRFQTDSTLSKETWVRALNYYLPQDIAVKEAYKVDNNFDVRRGAVSREYHYYILNSLVRSPLRRFAYFFSHPLDIKAMNKACQALIGEHDFAPFSSLTMGRTYRTAYKAEVHQRGDMVIFEIAANSFLPHQVRNTVGGLIKVGLGKTEVEEFCNLARSGQTRVIGPAVPAHGLCLMKVEYPCFPPLEKGDEDL